MRPSVFIFTFLLFVQLASSAWAQNAPDSVADNSKRKYSVYAEMGKAPDKFRSKQNPLKNDPANCGRGQLVRTTLRGMPR
jgi:hypothetical protein